MNPNSIVVLEIGCWSFSIGGEHYYGHLHGYIKNKYESMELSHPLTLKEVKYLNKKDSRRTYEVGDMSERFETEDEVRERAKKVWKDLFPESLVLMEGGLQWPILNWFWSGQKIS